MKIQKLLLLSMLCLLNYNSFFAIAGGYGAVQVINLYGGDSGHYQIHMQPVGKDPIPVYASSSSVYGSFYSTALFDEKDFTEADVQNGLYVLLVSSVDLASLTSLTPNQVDKIIGDQKVYAVASNHDQSKIAVKAVPNFTTDQLYNGQGVQFGGSNAYMADFYSNTIMCFKGNGPTPVKSPFNMAPVIAKTLVEPGLKKLSLSAASVSIPDIDLQDKIKGKKLALLTLSKSRGGQSITVDKLSDLSSLALQPYSGSTGEKVYSLIGSKPTNVELQKKLKSVTDQQLSKGIFLYPYTADGDGNNIDQSASTSSSKKSRALWVAIYDSAGSILGSYRVDDGLEFTYGSTAIVAESSGGSRFTTLTRPLYGEVIFVTTNPHLTVDDIALSSQASMHMSSASGSVGVVNVSSADIDDFEIRIPFSNGYYGLIQDPAILTSVAKDNFVTVSVDIEKDINAGKFTATVNVSDSDLSKPLPYKPDLQLFAISNDGQSLYSISGDIKLQDDNGNAIPTPTSLEIAYKAKNSDKYTIVKDAKGGVKQYGMQFMITRPAQKSSGTSVQDAGGIGLVSLPSTDITSFIVETKINNVSTGLDLDETKSGGKVSGLDVLKNNLNLKKSVSISVEISENESGGYNGHLVMYADSQAVFEYDYKGLTSYMVYQGNLVPVGTVISASSSDSTQDSPRSFDIYYTLKSDPNKDKVVKSQPAHFVVTGGMTSEQQDPAAAMSAGNAGLVTLPSNKVTDFIIAPVFTSKATNSDVYAKINLKDYFDDINAKIDASYGSSKSARSDAKEFHTSLQSILEKGTCSISIDARPNATSGNFDITLSVSDSENNTILTDKTYKNVPGYLMSNSAMLNSGDNISTDKYTFNHQVEVLYTLSSDPSKKVPVSKLPTTFVIATQKNVPATHSSLYVGLGKIPHDTTAFNLEVWYMTSEKKPVSQNIILNFYAKKLFDALKEGPVFFNIIPNLQARKIAIGAQTSTGKSLFVVTNNIPASVTEGGMYAQTLAAYTTADKKTHWLKGLATFGAQRFMLMYEGSGSSVSVAGSDSLGLAKKESVTGLEVVFNFTSNSSGEMVRSMPMSLPKEAITKLQASIAAQRVVTLTASAVKGSDGNYTPVIRLTDPKSITGKPLYQYPTSKDTPQVLTTKDVDGDIVDLTSENVSYKSLSVGYQTSNMSSMKLQPVQGKAFAIARSQRVRLVTPGKAIPAPQNDPKKNDNVTPNSSNDGNQKNQTGSGKPKSNVDPSKLTGIVATGTAAEIVQSFKARGWKTAAGKLGLAIHRSTNPISRDDAMKALRSIKPSMTLRQERGIENMWS